MQNEFSDFFDDSSHQGVDFKWQPDASLGVDQFLLDTEQNSFENFFAESAQEKKNVFSTFPQPFSSLPLTCELPVPTMSLASPLTTPTPSPSTQLSATSLLSAMDKKLPNELEKTPPPSKSFSEKQYSLPFSFGSSQKPNPLFIPKKAKNSSLILVQPQDLCSRTTNQVAKDVQLIAEEKAQIRQLPQPQMHGVAQVTRSETERRFLAGCDAVSIEKKILSFKDSQTKNSLEKRKSTHLMEREDIPSELIRKRGRKAKVISSNKELISFSNLLPCLLAARKNAEEFHKSIPTELSSDIALLEESINEAALKYLAGNNADLIAKVFLDMIPRLQHTLIYQFLMLLFSQHSTVRCSVNTETFSNDPLSFFSTVAGILSKEPCVSTLCNGKLTLLDPLAYKQLPPSCRNNVCFEDRLLWTMAVLSQKNISLFEPIAALRVLSLARYSLQLFRFAFRSLVVLKEKEFIEYLLILGNQDSLNMLVYLAYVCEETKKISVATIARVLCQRKDQLGSMQRILTNGNVEIHIIRHLLVYFYRKDASTVETIKSVAARDSVLFDVAELLIGEKTSDKHEKFIESLRNLTICNFLTEFIQNHDVVKARDVFLHSLEYQISDLASFYGNLIDSNTLNVAPTAVVLKNKLYAQTPLPVKINDSCVFFATGQSTDITIDLIHMITEPAQRITMPLSDLALQSIQIFASVFDENSDSFEKPKWHALEKFDCQSIANVIFCNWQCEQQNLTFAGATRLQYESQKCFMERYKIPAVQNNSLRLPFVRVRNPNLISINDVTEQAIHIDILKMIVDYAYNAPSNISSSEFVEHFCKERNYVLSLESD